jgi:hypothetical protein
VSDPKRLIVSEFACTGCMSAHDDAQGCICVGCVANRAICQAVLGERNRLAAEVASLAAEYREDGQIVEAEVAEYIAERIPKGQNL